MKVEHIPVLGTAVDLSNSRPAMAPTCDTCYMIASSKHSDKTDLFAYGAILCRDKEPAENESQHAHVEFTSMECLIHVVIVGCEWNLRGGPITALSART